MQFSRSSYVSMFHNHTSKVQNILLLFIVEASSTGVDDTAAQADNIALAKTCMPKAYISMAFTCRFTCSLIQLFGYLAIGTFQHSR